MDDARGSGAQNKLNEVWDRLREIAEHVGDWDDQEVRDEIEQVIAALEATE